MIKIADNYEWRIRSLLTHNSVCGFMPLVQVFTIVSVEMNEIFMSTGDTSTEARKKPTRERYHLLLNANSVCAFT